MFRSKFGRRTGQILIVGLMLMGMVLLAGCGEDSIESLPEAQVIPGCPTPMATVFDDQTGTTPMGVAWSNCLLYSVSGGTTGGDRFAQYQADGTLIQKAAPGVDFRGIFTNNAGDLFAKGYGAAGTIYSVTPNGVATPLFDLNDPESQAMAAFSGDDSEIYVRSASIVRRYSSSTGAPVGSFTLTGLAGDELSGTESYQLATNDAGRIFTYATGNISEWDLSGTRLWSLPVPIATPIDGNTVYSFSIAGNKAFLYNSNTAQWEGYGF